MTSLKLCLTGLLMILGLTGCATTRFSGGMYLSGDGVIACKLPAAKGSPWAVKQEKQAGARAVEFVNDFDGTLYKIELIAIGALPPEIQKVDTQRLVMGTVSGPLFGNIRSVSPKATLMANVYRADFLGGAAIGVYQVPGGSPLAAISGEGRVSRADTTRSVVVFRSGPWLVVATHIGEHLSAILKLAKVPPTPEEQSKINLPPLADFAESIRIGAGQ